MCTINCGLVYFQKTGLLCIKENVDLPVRQHVGRAIAQAVSRWLPTAAARVQTRVYVHVGFVMDKSGAGAGFLRVLWFPLPIIISPISPSYSMSRDSAVSIATGYGLDD
jgi:hypothetical protein